MLTPRTVEIEQEILGRCWQQADTCPQCSNEFSLLIGPEHDDGRHVVVPDCELCDAVMTQLLGGIDP